MQRRGPQHRDARFQPRDIEILGDHAGEALDLVVDGEIHLAAALRADVVVRQQLGHALDGSEGRAHFVRDQRDDVVLGLLQLVLPRDVGERCHDAQHRPAVGIAGRDGGHAQGVVPRARAAHHDFTVDPDAIRYQPRQRIVIQRSRQPPLQVLAHQPARGGSQNGARGAIGKRDAAVGSGDDQAIFHRAQCQVHEFGALEQARIEFAERARFPLQALGQPAARQCYGAALHPMVVGAGDTGPGRRQQVARIRQFLDVGIQARAGVE